MPSMPPPQRNKAVLSGYSLSLSLSHPLIRPFFGGVGVALGVGVTLKVSSSSFQNYAATVPVTCCQNQKNPLFHSLTPKNPKQSFQGSQSGSFQSHTRWAPTIVINGVIKPYKWPKINGFAWVFFRPTSGVMGPYS